MNKEVVYTIESVKLKAQHRVEENKGSRQLLTQDVNKYKVQIKKLMEGTLEELNNL